MTEFHKLLSPLAVDLLPEKDVQLSCLDDS